MIKRNLFSWQYLKWDSEILERRTTKIISFKSQGTIKERRKLVKKLLKGFLDEKIAYATYRLNASDFLTIHALEEEGFRLVDGLICLELELNASFKGIPNNIRPAVKEDAEKLQNLAHNAFSQTRFYNDPQVKKYQADRIYSEWIKNSINGPMANKVFVFKEKGNALGFITLKKNGNIVLIAVDKRQRGKGIGKSLVQAAINQFLKWSLKKSTIETQMTNMSALRTYQSCGYKIKNSFLTFRWSDNI